MRRATSDHPARVSRVREFSRAPTSKTASTADDRPRKTNNVDDDICLDNDLGAEWTGNIDCYGGATKNDGSNNRKDP
jgi:hypothetical protein